MEVVLQQNLLLAWTVKQSLFYPHPQQVICNLNMYFVIYAAKHAKMSLHVERFKSDLNYTLQATGLGQHRDFFLLGVWNSYVQVRNR